MFYSSCDALKPELKEWPLFLTAPHGGSPGHLLGHPSSPDHPCLALTTCEKFESALNAERSMRTRRVVRGGTSFNAGPVPGYAARRAPSTRLSFASQSVSMAPSGTSPCSTYRQSAISSFLANATIPIRFMRDVPPPNRR